ncbi:unnamed protein product [Cochlearia groenlandica]
MGSTKPPRHNGVTGTKRCQHEHHSELHGLMFAMDILKERRHNCSNFYTDCKDLVDMVSMPRLWPAFSAELETLLLVVDGNDQTKEAIVKNKLAGLSSDFAYSGTEFYSYLSDSTKCEENFEGLGRTYNDRKWTVFFWLVFPREKAKFAMSVQTEMKQWFTGFVEESLENKDAAALRCLDGSSTATVLSHLKLVMSDQDNNNISNRQD